jgi:hypothetical protein
VSTLNSSQIQADFGRVRPFARIFASSISGIGQLTPVSTRGLVGQLDSKYGSAADVEDSSARQVEPTPDAVTQISSAVTNLSRIFGAACDLLSKVAYDPAIHFAKSELEGSRCATPLLAATGCKNRMEVCNAAN